MLVRWVIQHDVVLLVAVSDLRRVAWFDLFFLHVDGLSPFVTLHDAPVLCPVAESVVVYSSGFAYQRVEYFVVLAVVFLYCVWFETVQDPQFLNWSERGELFVDGRENGFPFYPVVRDVARLFM